jgi:hypothetical protein
LLEATERGFDLGIACELPALGLGKPLQRNRRTASKAFSSSFVMKERYGRTI